MTFGWFLVLICAVALALAVWSAMKSEEAQREASRKADQRLLDELRRR